MSLRRVHGVDEMRVYTFLASYFGKDVGQGTLLSEIAGEGLEYHLIALCELEFQVLIHPKDQHLIKNAGRLAREINRAHRVA